MNVIAAARAWIAQDPDPQTRAELLSLIAKHDVEALEERFSGSLEFGTAGLRGLLGAGPTRMNRITVARATAGLCAWLKEQIPDAVSRGICVARDARRNSDVFERDVIEIATGAGIPVAFFAHVAPTPVLAFAVVDQKAAAGVMITASHNPPGYNGYKVYWENGAQIIPPHDRGIAREMQRVPSVDRIARLSMQEARQRGMLREIDSVRQEYIEAIASEFAPPKVHHPVRVAYTALHGVAGNTFLEVLARAGFHDVHCVPEQQTPDSHFPTVDFPNPEEPGTMDRVLSLADEVDADLAIANDPDGDRVGVAVCRRHEAEILSGNDIGILLADDLLSQYRGEAQPVVLSTIVSSPMLGPIAARHGALWEQTLTGHKWIQNRALELEREGFAFVFGYEEALGYAPSKAVRDKDGISSALCLVNLTARLKASGQDLLDAREALWREHGFCADRQISRRFEGSDAKVRMAEVVDGYRRHPPSAIGGKRVLAMADLERKTRWTPAGETPFVRYAESTVLIFELEGGHRAMVRPSGTEPKLKYYFYAVAPPTDTMHLAASQQAALSLLQGMVEDLVPSDRH
jgi:phosphomannomutase